MPYLTIATLFLLASSQHTFALILLPIVSVRAFFKANAFAA
jgi:hypothetical protein